MHKDPLHSLDPRSPVDARRTPTPPIGADSDRLSAVNASATRAVSIGVVVLLAATIGVGFYLAFGRSSPPPSPHQPPSLSVLPAAPEVNPATPPISELSQEKLYEGLIRAIQSEDYTALRAYAQAITPLDRELLAKDSMRSRASILSVAVRHGNMAMIEEVIKHQIAFDQPDQEGRRAIHIAALEGRAEALVLLASQLKIPLDAQVAATGNTAMHLAAQAGRQNVITAILKLEPQSTGFLNAMNRTPLHEATAGGQLTSTEALLLPGGPEIRAADVRRHTPLHLAALRGDVEIIRLLLRHGADPNARDLQDHTPADLADSEGHAAAASLLR